LARQLVEKHGIQNKKMKLGGAEPFSSSAKLVKDKTVSAFLRVDFENYFRESQSSRERKGYGAPPPIDMANVLPHYVHTKEVSPKKLVPKNFLYPVKFCPEGRNWARRPFLGWF
jgi:hypothetical protein